MQRSVSDEVLPRAIWSAKMAAMAGVYLHGMAGDVAAGKKGPRSMLASDILEAIPTVLCIQQMPQGRFTD